jgi:hypothetical protein
MEISCQLHAPAALPPGKESLEHIRYTDKNRMMDNVQKHNICINVPTSQILDLIIWKAG